MTTAPGAIGDYIPYGTDPATGHVLVSAEGDPPRWFVLSPHDWTTEPVTAPSGETVHEADWRSDNVAALALAADGWHYVEGARDTPLAGTAGLDAQHIGFRCAGAICVVRWHAESGMIEARVDDAGVAAPAPSAFPPGKSSDWALLPDGRRALILKSDPHTISIEGGAKDTTVASTSCLFALTFAATDATSVTTLCATTNGSSRLVRMPLDGSPATVLETTPDISLGATVVDATHVLVTSLVEAATVSVVQLH